MANKTLINGTEYEIMGGKTLVNGAEYDITQGCTLIDGTEYSINMSSELIIYDGGDTVEVDSVLYKYVYPYGDTAMCEQSETSVTGSEIFNGHIYLNPVFLVDGVNYTNPMISMGAIDFSKYNTLKCIISAPVVNGFPTRISFYHSGNINDFSFSVSSSFIGSAIFDANANVIGVERTFDISGLNNTEYLHISSNSYPNTYCYIDKIWLTKD